MKISVNAHGVGAAGRMSDVEFNGLLNGPLAHPAPLMRLTRLALALRRVLDKTGPDGAKALREVCQEELPGDDERQDN